MHQSQFAKLLTPSSVVFVWQLFLSFLVLVAGSAHIIVYLVSGQEELADESSLITSAIDSILATVDQYEVSADLVTFFFWAVLGSAVYALLWGVASLLVELYRDVSFGFSFIHPREFNRSEHWAATVSTILMRISSAILLMAFFTYWISVIIPFLSDLVSQALNSLSPLGLLSIALATASCTIGLHAMTIFIRIFLLRTRVFNA